MGVGPSRAVAEGSAAADLSAVAWEPAPARREDLVEWALAVIPGPDGSPTCALDATIYELHLNAEKIGQIDADDLTRSASSAAAFEKALAELGQSKPLYRAHQSVRLSGDEIRIGTQVPYITNSQVTNTGQTINSVTYREVGAIFNVSGKASTSSMELDLSIQVSVIGDNGVAITDTVKAPMFRSSTMEHRGEATPGQPFVLMSVDAASTDDHGQAVAYMRGEHGRTGISDQFARWSDTCGTPGAKHCGMTLGRRVAAAVIANR